ncbi:MAG: YdcF family protein [Alphaproteobacteria bacterium]|nr:YdcF family protein [Alphaproteobacteria bacterium]
MTRPIKSAHRTFRALLLTLGLLALIWSGGLAAFAFLIPTEPTDRTSLADGIVVLTGGSERIEEGLTLLRSHLGRKLLVTGVSEGLTMEDVLGAKNARSEEVACCVELGHTAENTAGNASETARWMALEGFKSLRLVTGSYHMPRSLLEFRRAMPETRVIANPVFPGHVKVEQWWRFRGTAKLIASEHAKYIGARLNALLSSSPTPDKAS